MSITVKVTSDFICPWCQIGEKRLLNAIESLPKDISVEIEWLPFELNPDMPLQGIDRKTYRTMKFGSWEQAQARDAQTIAAGAEDGVRFEYDKIQITPNTFAAHRLAWLAAQEGKQPVVVLAILNAYFHEGPGYRQSRCPGRDRARRWSVRRRRQGLPGKRGGDRGRAGLNARCPRSGHSRCSTLRYRGLCSQRCPVSRSPASGVDGGAQAKGGDGGGERGRVGG